MLRSYFVVPAAPGLRFVTTVLAFFLALGLASTASAQLVIDVEGTPNAASSQWTFSGGVTAISLQAPPADVSLGSNNYLGTLNNYQGSDITSGSPGSFSVENLSLTGTTTVTGTTSGAHTLEGFTFQGQPGAPVSRFAWFGDGAFTGLEGLVFAGVGIANFNISTITGINAIGDTATLTAATANIGTLTINFTAVPEPGTALLVGLGLAGIAAHGRRTQR